MTTSTTTTADSPSAHLSAPSPPAAALGWFALAMVLVPAILRATLPLVDVPAWGTSPLLVLDPALPRLPDVGLTPAACFLCDASAILGAGILILLNARSSAAAGLGRLALLALLGSAAIIYHGYFADFASPGSADRRIGAAWASAVIGAVGILAACAHPRQRSVCAAVLVGLAALLLAKGAVQIAIEHPAAIADYRQARDAILSSRGWAPDSPQALGYERRLLHPDPTGFFAFGNIYASILAAAAVAAGTIGISLWRQARSSRSIAAPLIALAAICAAMVIVGGSKGAIAAMLLGAAAAATLAALRRSTAPRAPALARWLLPALIALALAAVAIRGLIGERLGELSLYFRSMYIEAAARIFAGHPSTGVGPAGFKDAYLLARNPLSPEEVSSPHSILFDWLACLGLAGAAWAVILLALAYRAGQAASLDRPEPLEPSSIDTGDSRTQLRVAAAIVVLASLIACYVERHAMTPEAAAVRIVGMIAWAAIAGLWITADRVTAAARIALAGAAATLLIQSQIEMTISWPQSAALVMAFIAVAAARPSPAPAALPRRRLTLAVRFLSASLMLLGGLLLIPAAALPAARWAAALDSAADIAHPSGQAAAIARALAAPTTPDADRSDLAARLQATLTAAGLAPTDPRRLSPLDLARLDALLLPRAAAALRDAGDMLPEAASLLQRAAGAALALAPPPSPAQPPTDAINLLTRARAWLIEAQANDSTALWQRAGVERQLARLTANTIWLEHAADTLRQGLARDPYSLQGAVSLARILALRADAATPGTQDPAGLWRTRAADAARRALDIHALKRLDAAVAGLGAADLAEMQSIAGR